MSATSAMPRQVAIALNDMLDNCACVQPGEQVLILAHVDGLYGGENLVDEETIAWTQAGVQARGGHASVLWIDEPQQPHAWQVPPVLKAAMAGADVLISHSFDLQTEEIRELGAIGRDNNVRILRNFATTAPMLASTWAQTPHELVAKIRIEAGSMFKQDVPFKFTDPNGTHLEGTTGALSFQVAHRRTPFPEWVYPPVNIIDTEGVLVFDRMLSWWSRYIGIPPFFKEPIRLTIEHGRITHFEGGVEAEALHRFLDSLAERYGEGAYEVPAVHGGVHPNASIAEHQCPAPLQRRWVEHAHTSNIHFHLGNIRDKPGWPYMLHVTGDVRKATWQVGDVLINKDGYLTALDHPEVRAIAERYPDRPGLIPQP